MTLSASENNVSKVLLRYVLVTVFCACVGLVYEQFSHGVSSNWMMYFFLLPLIGGVVPCSIFLKYPQLSYPNGWCRLFYHSAIATLTIGSCMRGVLEIYGTSSALLAWYARIGAAFLIAAVLCAVFQKKPA